MFFLYGMMNFGFRYASSDLKLASSILVPLGYLRNDMNFKRMYTVMNAFARL